MRCGASWSMKRYASMYKETEVSACLLARNDYVLRRHGTARKALLTLKTGAAIVYQVSTVIVASGPSLVHCRGRGVLRGSRLQLPCIWASHYKAEWVFQIWRCSGIFCEGESFVRGWRSRLRTNMCREVNVLPKLVYKDPCVPLCGRSGTGTIDVR